MKPTDLPERLASRIAVDDNRCWIWMGSITASGYGNAWVPGMRGTRAHRITYELLVGPIPDGLDLDHLCRVRNCVNPTHLEPVTRRENLRRSPLLRKGVRAAKNCPTCGIHLDSSTAYVYSDGSRVCRECKKSKVAAAYRRKKSATP